MVKYANNNSRNICFGKDEGNYELLYLTTRVLSHGFTHLSFLCSFQGVYGGVTGVVKKPMEGEMTWFDRICLKTISYSKRQVNKILTFETPLSSF